MKKALTAVLAASLLAPLAHAGVPTQFSAEDGKWMRVNENWTVDTEDVKVQGDKIRFWVRRNPTGNEEMSTQVMTRWTGKYQVRCSDFHARLAGQYYNGMGGYYYEYGNWEKMTQDHFGTTLASNFCHLTGTPGYTAEPIEHAWQRKITETITTGPKRKSRSTNDVCDDGTRHPRCR